MYIARIAVDPRDSSIAFAAALGSRARVTESRGLYKTTDAGRTWHRILFINGWTGAADVALDQNDPDTVFAATWQEAERDGVLYPRGPGSGLYRSKNGGATWEKLAPSPGATLGRIALSISRARPGRIYAVIDDDSTSPWKFAYGRAFYQVGGLAHLYVSDDHGNHWTRKIGVVAFADFGDYYVNLCTDPGDPSRVYLPSFRLISSNAGDSFERFKYVEDMGDEHACWVDPANPEHVVAGADTGVWQSFDRGLNWEHLNLFSGGLWYSVAADAHKPFYRVFGAVQDYAGLLGPSRTRHSGDIRGNDILEGDWRVTGLPEEGGVTASEADPDVEYGFGPTKYNVKTRLTERLELDLGFGSKYALCYTAHSTVVISRRNSATLYYGDRGVLRSTDSGHTWHELTGSLTGQVPITARVMGMTWRVPAYASWYLCVSAIAESPLDDSVLYAGTSNGRMYASLDRGRRWRLVTPVGMPAGASISKIVPSRLGPRVAYVTASNTGNGDYGPYIFKTVDGGMHWSSVANNLPKTAAVWSLVEDPNCRSLLFIGTDEGVYVSRNGGQTWSSLRNNMPAIRVYDLALQPQDDDLIAATWGRGVFILDYIKSLELLDTAQSALKGYLFPIRQTAEFLPRGSQGSLFPWQGGPNPPYGAPIDYFNSMLNGRSKIYVLDNANRFIASVPAESGSGVHRSIWDLAIHYKLSVTGSVAIPVPPGRYRIRLFEGGKTVAERSMSVAADPDVRLTRSEYASRFATLRKSVKIQLDAEAVLAQAENLNADLARAQVLVSQVHLKHAASTISALELRIKTLRQSVLHVLAEFYPNPAVYDIEPWMRPLGVADRVAKARQAMTGLGMPTKDILGVLARAERQTRRLSTRIRSATINFARLKVNLRASGVCL